MSLPVVHANLNVERTGTIHNAQGIELRPCKRRLNSCRVAKDAVAVDVPHVCQWVAVGVGRMRGIEREGISLVDGVGSAGDNSWGLVGRGCSAGELGVIGKFRRVACGIGRSGGDELAGRECCRESHGEADIAGVVGSYLSCSEQFFAFAEAAGISDVVDEKLKLENGVGRTIERAGNAGMDAVGDYGSQNGIVLQVIVAGVGVAGIIRCHAIKTQINSKSRVVEDGVRVNSNLLALVDIHTGSVVGDDVAVARSQAANQIAGRIRGLTGNPNSIGYVPNRRHAIRADADLITLHNIAGPVASVDADAHAPVTGDDVAVAGIGPADQIVVAIDANSVVEIAQRRQAGDIGANVVALDYIVVRAEVDADTAPGDDVPLTGQRPADRHTVAGVGIAVLFDVDTVATAELEQGFGSRSIQANDVSLDNGAAGLKERNVSSQEPGDHIARARS